MEGRGVASGASSWAVGEAGTEACGPSLCPHVHTCLTHETTVMECGDSRVFTRTLRLKVEVPGHLTWACGASPAELPACPFPKLSQTCKAVSRSPRASCPLGTKR